MHINRRQWAGRVSAAGLAGLKIGCLPSQAAAATGAGRRPDDLQLWGYYPWWMDKLWQTQDLSLYDRLKFFDVEVDDGGKLAQRQGWPERWQPLKADALTRGTRVDVTVTLFDAKRFELVFGNADRRRQLLAELLALGGTADGIHLDLEIFQAIAPEVLRAARTLCSQLKAGLVAQGGGTQLSAFGVMGAVTDLYNRAAMEHFDHLVLQGYDFHHAASRRAGPVAALRGAYPVTWETTLRHYLALGAPRHKIIFGVPFYGYEWPTESAHIGARATGRGREITYGLVDARLLPRIRTSAQAQAAAHGLRRDPASGSPYYAYQDADGGWHQGWFEDETSLAEKIAFVRKEQLAGIAVFPVGYDNGAFDKLLRRAVKGR